MSDRRIAHRVPVRLTATYRSPTTTAAALVTDVSRHGLFLAGIPGDTIGTDAVIEVELPHASVSLQGRVARKDGCAFGIGIRFADLPDDERRALANLVLSVHSLH